MIDTDTTEPMDAPADAPPAHDPLNPDPAAPYGRTDDGVLLDRNGKRALYGLTKSGLRKDHAPGRKRGSGPALGRKQASRVSGRTITVKRRQGLTGLFDIPKGILLGVGYKADNDALLADAVTLDMHAPTFAQAVAELCEDNDRLAQVVDRVIEVGPLAAVSMAAGAMFAQLARNHQAIPDPVATMLGGAHDPQELAQVARGSLANMEAAPNGQQHTQAA